MPPLLPGFTCASCGRQYHHSSHLRRHEASHSGSEQFKCDHCERSFRRRDVWRKHYLSCPSNNKKDEPPPAKRGKKPRACDNCFRSKLSCDGNPSCARCTSRRLTCTYARVQGGGNNVSPLSANLAGRIGPPASTTDHSLLDSGPNRDENTKIPVSFLLSLTNPEAKSMVGAFLNDPASRDDDDPSVELRPDVNINTDLAQDAAPSDGVFFPWVFGQIYSDPFLDLGSFSLPETDCPHSEDTDPALEPIVSELESLYNTLTATDPSYSGTFDPSLAKQVFTRANRETFIPTYFRHTHRHLPLIHRPSFSPEASSPPLILVIFLCGAMYAAPRDCVLAIPRFFHIAEEYVFRKLEAQMGMVQQKGGPNAADVEMRALEMEMYQTFQAAMLIQGAQFMINSPTARNRNFVARKLTMVDGVRKLGLTNARHREVKDVEGGRLDWAGWVRDETRIRIATWTLLNDWQQGGMFHIPGSMTIHEMTGELPSLHQLWEANDGTEFEAAIAANGEDCWRRSASLRDCMDAFMANPWWGVEDFPLRHLTMLDLQIFISTIHVMIGTARLLSLLQTSIPALQRATDRWQELWRGVVGQLDDEALRMSGFARHSGEFCWLAKALLEHSLAGKDKTSPYFQRIGHESPKELHALLRELRGV